MTLSWLSRISLGRHDAAPPSTVLPPRTKEETERLEKKKDANWAIKLANPDDETLGPIRDWDDPALDRGERWWRDMVPFLEQSGYKLRPRYQFGWRPSWESTSTGRMGELSEDGYVSRGFDHVMDAVRICDNLPVMLKRSRYSTNGFEIDCTIGTRRTVAGAEPRNHATHIYDILDVPNDEDATILVLPLLRQWDEPGFETIGEAVDFFGQIFEGMRELHYRGLAHRDSHFLNIMMDARSMYPDGWHPVETTRCPGDKFHVKARHFSRTQRPPKYYIIDFGISGSYDRRFPVRDVVVRGGDKSCPEHGGNATHTDPFPTDVYYIGNVIKELFVEGKKGFGFMADLVKDMTLPDPQARPTIDEVVRVFDVIRSNLSQRQLRSRVISFKDSVFYQEPVGFMKFWRRRIGYVLQGLPAVPVAGYP